MQSDRGISRRHRILTTGALPAALTAGPCAYATQVHIQFNGALGHGSVNLTLAPDPDSSSSYVPTFNQADADATPPISPPRSPYDPERALHITGTSGTFSSTTLGINKASITGVQALDLAAAPPGETLPKSFSLLGNNSHDNLFYPNGSPLVCPPVGPTPYTFHGGFLDIFGVMFVLDDEYVALWSDGITPTGLTYGMAVLTPQVGGGYSVKSQPGGVTAAVPEPGLLWLPGAGLLGFFAWRRSLEARRNHIA